MFIPNIKNLLYCFARFQIWSIIYGILFSPLIAISLFMRNLPLPLITFIVIFVFVFIIKLTLKKIFFKEYKNFTLKHNLEKITFLFSLKFYAMTAITSTVLIGLFSWIYSPNLPISTDNYTVDFSKVDVSKLLSFFISTIAIRLLVDFVILRMVINKNAKIIDKSTSITIIEHNH